MQRSGQATADRSEPLVAQVNLSLTAFDLGLAQFATSLIAAILHL